VHFLVFYSVHRKFLASIGEGNKSSFLVETCLVVNPTDFWCVDSGSTNHVCNTLQGSRQLSKGKMYLIVGDGTRVPVHYIRVVYLHFGSRVSILSNCLYLPCIHRN
jgi:hypothetical protein